MRSLQDLSVGVPRVPGDVISRPRITAMIDSGLPLTLVRGACGSGKTVALREWATTADVSVVWITADEDAADSPALATALLQRLRHLSGARSEAGSASGWGAVRNAFHGLAEPVVVIVDDAATLHRDALVDICRVVGATDDVRLIAAANRRTVLDTDGVALIVDRSLVGPMDLMFDQDEIARILDVDDALAAEILEATSGFPAVIHAIAKRGLPDPGRPLLETAVEAVEQYMRMRVARSGYDRVMLRTLLRVSVVDEVDVALAEALSGDPNAARILDAAESFGFGAWSGAGAGRTFRYAPFARLLLRRELQRAHLEELPSLRRTAAEWALRNGNPIDALRLSVEGDDLALASRVVTATWYELLENHGRAVIDVLGDVPLSRLRDEPLLVMLLAICYNATRTRRLRGLQLFRIAVAAANSGRHDLPPSDRLFIWAAESVALRLLGMSDRSANVAVRALRLLAEMPEAAGESYADELPRLCAQLGISLYYGGLERQAIECFSYAVALSTTRSPDHGFHSLAMLSGIHALAGDIPEARHYVEVIRQGAWPTELLDGYRGTFYRVAEAMLALEDSDPVSAAEHVAKFEPHKATSEHWLTMAVVEGLVALRSGRAAFGLTQLESFVSLRAREAHGSAARNRLSRIRALLHLAMGDTAMAKSVLHRDGADDRYETIVERARVALVEDRPGDALRMLTQTGVAASTPRLRASAAMLKAAALLRTAGPVAARREMEHSAALLCDRQLRMPLALLPPADLDALAPFLVEMTPCDLGVVTSALGDSRPAPRLTRRERVVLGALLAGMSSAGIAAELGVSLNTVKTQLRSVYRKLGVTTREEAIAVAVAHDLIVDRA